MKSMSMATLLATLAGSLVWSGAAACTILDVKPSSIGADVSSQVVLHGTDLVAAATWNETVMLRDVLSGRSLNVTGSSFDDQERVSIVVPSGTFEPDDAIVISVVDKDDRSTVLCKSFGAGFNVHGSVSISHLEEVESKNTRPNVFNINARRGFKLFGQGIVPVEKPDVWVKYMDSEGNDLGIRTSGEVLSQGDEFYVQSTTPIVPKPLDWLLNCENPKAPVPSENCAWDIIISLSLTIDGGISFTNPLNMTVGYERPLRIAFMYVGPVNDFGWTYQFDIARVGLEAKYGAEVDASTYYESLPEGDYESRQENRGNTIATDTPVPAFWEDGSENRYYKSFQLMKQFCDEDYDLVVAASSGLMLQSVDVSTSYLGCQKQGKGTEPGALDHNTFFLNTGFRTTPRLSTAFSKIYQVRYLTGLVAGYQLQINKLQKEKDPTFDSGDDCVGYIASYPVPQVTRGINAFTVGCREVFPECTVKVIWMGTWNKNDLEKHGAAFLWHVGKCRIVTQHSVTTEPQKYFLEMGGSGIGYNSDARTLVGDSVLTSSILTWQPVLEHFIEQISQSKWNPDSRDPTKGGDASKQEQAWLGLEREAARLAPYFSPRVPQDIQETILRKRAELAKDVGADAFHRIFCGDLKKRWHIRTSPDPAHQGRRMKGCGGQPVWERLEEPQSLNPLHFWDSAGRRLTSANETIKPTDCLYGVDFPGQALLQSAYPEPFNELRVFSDFLLEGVELFEPTRTIFGIVYNESDHKCVTSYGTTGDRFFVAPPALPKCDGTQWVLVQGECNSTTGFAPMLYDWVVDPTTGDPMYCGTEVDEAGVLSIVADLPQYFDPNKNSSQVVCAKVDEEHILDTLPITFGTMIAGLLFVIFMYRVLKKKRQQAGNLLDFLFSPLVSNAWSLLLALGGSITDCIAAYNLYALDSEHFNVYVSPYITVVTFGTLFTLWATWVRLKACKEQIARVYARRRSIASAPENQMQELSEYLEKELDLLKEEASTTKLGLALLVVRDIPSTIMNFILIATDLAILKDVAFALATIIGLIVTVIEFTHIPVLRSLRHEREVLKMLRDTIASPQPASKDQVLSMVLLSRKMSRKQ